MRLSTSLLFQWILFCSTFCYVDLSWADELVSNTTGGKYFTVEYEASEEPFKLQIGVEHTLWIPDSAKTIRGIIVHQHGCGVGACKCGETAAFDLHWQELARKWDCALLGPSYKQAAEQNCRLWCDPRNGSADVFDQAMIDLAKQSGHPEIADVPWCLWGHSGGGFWASLMQMSHAEKIVAIWFQSGTAHSRWVSGEIDKPEITEAAMQIPMIANPGFKERDHERFKVAYSGCYEMVKDYRKRGAPIAFAPDPITGHETGDSRYLAIPFFDACLELRLPEKAGTSNLKQIDMSKSAYRPLLENYEKDWKKRSGVAGEKPSVNWFPNEALAVQWEEFIQVGSVTDKTPPPAPFDIKVTEQKMGTVITWTVRADLESGIQSFIVLRDGEEIVTIPTEPKTRFGRPLFQKMSYGDTPDALLPEMEYLDEKGSATAKYQVIAVNSVGLKSE